MSLKQGVVALLLVLCFCCSASAQFTNTTVSGMSLWLKADAGIDESLEGLVNIWGDQSGNSNDFWADYDEIDPEVPDRRPEITTATINGSTHDVVRFDGIDDVMTAGVPGSTIPRQDHTIYFVTARTGGTTSTTGDLIGFDRYGGRGEDGWYYKFTEAAVNMEAGSGTSYAYQLSSAQPDNKFILGEGRFDSAGTTAELWVDCYPQGSTIAALTPLNEDPYTRLNIGAYDYPDGAADPTDWRSFFQGDIAEILVYDHALNATDQQTVRDYLINKYTIDPYVPPQPLPLTLKAKWSFEQDGSDSVGNSDMTLQAGATIVPGREGNGLSVTNSPTDGYASTPADPDLAIDYEFSVATWMKYDENNGDYARPIATKQDDDNGYNIAFQNIDEDKTTSQLVVRVLYEGLNYYVTTTDSVLTQDQYHHVAFAFDMLGGSDVTDKITLWIDGSEVSIYDSTIGGSVQGGTDLVLGRGTAETAEFSGMLDEVCFFTGALTQTEIDAMVVLVPGDANNDGVVNSEDAEVLATYWGQSVTGASKGDFNGDGVVNALDASIMAANWNTGAEASPVPEPSTFALIVSALLAAGWAVRRR